MAADTYVSNLVQHHHGNDTDYLYGLVRTITKQVRKVSDGSWEAWAPADIEDNVISEAVADGLLWSGDFRVEIANGWYIYEVRIRLTADPLATDPVIGYLKAYWNGEQLCVVDADDDGRILMSPEGLDNISITPPASFPTNFREMMIWNFLRFACKTIYSTVTDTFKVHNSSDVEVTSQDVTGVGTDNEQVGKGS